jgi:diaminopimelate epimerase
MPDHVSLRFDKEHKHHECQIGTVEKGMKMTGTCPCGTCGLGKSELKKEKI